MKTKKHDLRLRFKTQQQADRAWLRLVKLAEVYERNRNRCEYECAEYWYWHDLAIRVYRKAETLQAHGVKDQLAYQERMRKLKTKG